MGDAIGRWLSRVDAFQQRHRVLGLPVAVNKRFGEHDGTRLAATVSYYSFFSVFPLLLVFVTILGLVLEGDPELRQELVDGALGQIPLLGSQIAEQQEPLQGSVIALIVGLATAIWAGMAAVGALQQGLNELSDVPVHARSSFFVKRARSLAFLVVFGLGLVASVILSNLASLFDAGPVGGVLGIIATFVVNVVLLIVMFSVLPARRRNVRELMPGAVVGAFLLVLLQLLAGFVVRQLSGADDVYGTFAAVIGLLAWFHLLSRVVLLSAELNEVLADGLAPRTLMGSSEPTAADRRAILLDVQRIQRDPRMGYAVSVGDDVGTDANPLGDEPRPEAAETVGTGGRSDG